MTLCVMLKCFFAVGPSAGRGGMEMGEGSCHRTLLLETLLTRPCTYPRLSSRPAFFGIQTPTGRPAGVRWSRSRALSATRSTLATVTRPRRPPRRGHRRPLFARRPGKSSRRPSTRRYHTRSAFDIFVWCAVDPHVPLFVLCGVR